MKTYKITLTFTNPYIGQRNGGNRTLESGLSLKSAKKYLLDIHNELMDRYFTTLSGAIRYYKRRSPLDGLYQSDNLYRFDYDSRIYIIKAEYSLE